MKDPDIAEFWLITYPQIMYGFTYGDNAKKTILSEYDVVCSYSFLFFSFSSTIHVLICPLIGFDMLLFFRLNVLFARSNYSFWTYQCQY